MLWDKPTLTLHELVHLSMLLPDPETHSEDEYRLTYRYHIHRSAELAFIRLRLNDRAIWIFTGNVLLPIGLYSIEFAE